MQDLETMKKELSKFYENPRPASEVQAFLDSVDDDWDSEFSQFALRQKMIDDYGFSVPCSEVVDYLKGHYDHDTLIEIGGGTGYWAKLLDCYTTDCTEADNPYGFYIGDVKPMDMDYDASWIVKNNPHRNIFCSWPTYDRDWCHKALREMEVGTNFYYIGETRGGCTGNEYMFRYLEDNFVLKHRITMPNYQGIHDDFFVYEKVS